MSADTDEDALTERQALEIRAIVREELEALAQRIGAALCAPTQPAPEIDMPADLDAAIKMTGTETDLARLGLMDDAERQGAGRAAVLDTIDWRRRELRAQAPS